MIHFSGIDAERGGYRQPPIPEHELWRSLSGRLPRPETIGTGVRLDVCPESLAETGWGIIWSGTVDPQIEAALAPLLNRRRAQTAEPGAGRFWEFIHRGESGEAFLAARSASVAGPVNPRTFPYYVLLIGEPTGLDFEFQHRLGRSHLVGRLSFDSPDQYANYAANLVDAESGRATRPARAVIFGVRHPDDPPTEASVRHLARPLYRALGDVDAWRVDGVFESSATKTSLERLLGGDLTPSLLFTAGHAVYYRPESRVIHAKQGGLLCADWPGPIQWPGSNPPEHFLTAADIKDEADLRGLVLCSFGCYTAGTPLRDSFPDIVDGRVQAGRTLAPEPFVAALPKRLLGHPRGALAFLGHVDRAWPHSFHWGELPGQFEAFESAFRGWMAGRRVGLAMAPLAERRSTISEEIMRFWLREGAEIGDGREAELWIRYYDARSYVLLGDPAALPSVSRRDESI